MYRKHHTRAIVIKVTPTGESSLNLTFFTENFGVINVRAQGARKLNSRLRLNLQNFSFGEFSLIHGKSGWKLAGAETGGNFFEVFRKESDKLSVASNVLNLIKKLTDEEENPLLFEVVYHFLNFLRIAKKEEISTAECLVLLRILYNLGYMQHDPDFAQPMVSSIMSAADLALIAPRRSRITRLINESLKGI